MYVVLSWVLVYNYYVDLHMCTSYSTCKLIDIDR